MEQQTFITHRPGVSQGRRLAVMLLMVILLIEGPFLIPGLSRATAPDGLLEVTEQIRSPVLTTQHALFDLYQQLSPRVPVSQPVTIIAIDEKSIRAAGQWPWPRDRLAQLVTTVNAYQPAAIGLDFYMPEADQHSLQNLAQRLGPDHEALRAQLMAQPSNDFHMAMALSSSPSVLGAAGFTVKAFTTSDHLVSTPLDVKGTAPQPFVTDYPQVLASLPDFQHAAAGQALLSVSGEMGVIRRFPLITAVNGVLIPSMPLELFRVATRSSAIQIEASAMGIQSISVADLTVAPLWNGDLWPHYAPLETMRGRYLSAMDVLAGNLDPLMLQGKLVLIGLTGAGLSDMRFTALHEQVPGVEIQAQVIESLFDQALLQRPSWLPVAELLLVLAIGGALITFAPRPETRIGAMIKHRPSALLAMVGIAAVALLVIGYLLFVTQSLLFASTNVIIGITLVAGVFFVHTTLLNLAEARAKLSRLVDSGIILGQLREQDAVLEVVSNSLNALAPCEASVILLPHEDSSLQPVALQGLAGDWQPAFRLQKPTSGATAQNRSLLMQALQSTRIVVVDKTDGQNPQLASLQGVKTTKNRPAESALVVPIVFSDQSAEGLLVLINAVNTAGSSMTGFDAATIRLVEALVSQAAVALENHKLLESQQNMMDSMVKIIAGAIDEKSPYTGGHCERVPELAEMLCKAACEVNEGPLAEFAFTTDDEWREFKTAAWLHDCGKITTPEHVMDKATKLETICDRIHEVRTRFEVLLRDAQISRLEAIHQQGIAPDIADQQFAQRKQQLEDDFAFIAECNQGGEFLSPDKVERIQQIASQRWIRNFDNRLGLSHVELERHARYTPVPVPATEPLLSDRPEHLIERPSSTALDERFGFKMEIPEYLYNHGELHNLTISRGTLTSEERFKINEHMIHTIAILEQVPFPPELARIPEYAGAHHETLIGTGYPRKLTAEQLSIPARVMAIADIFEALTAADRPYKKAKTLSEAIRILSFFKKDQHIDPDLFDLFLTAGIYKQYAEHFLSPEQIDEVDINQYIG